MNITGEIADVCLSQCSCEGYEMALILCVVFWIITLVFFIFYAHENGGKKNGGKEENS